MDESRQAPYWRFSLAVYGQPGVSDACLALQSRLGLDVNLLLLALYAAAVYRRPVSVQEITEAHALTDPWHQEVVKTLRSLRTRLKTWPAGEDAARVSAFREHIKAIEIDAEHLEQRLLAQWVNTLNSSTSSAEGSGMHLATARNVLIFYVERLGGVSDLTPLEKAVARISKASADVAGQWNESGAF